MPDQRQPRYFVDPELEAASGNSGPHWDRYEMWRAKVGAVETKARACLRHVKIGKGHGSSRHEDELCRAIRGSRDTSHWFDHVKMVFVPATGEYLVTSQPYGVHEEMWADMQAFAERHGLEVTLSIEDAWWLPGATSLIVWRRKALK